MKIRVSYGTAVVLGLKKGKMFAKPTTAYFMTYYDGRCLNNCAFCVQARGSKSNLEKLSRITWPAFELKEVVEKLESSKFARICLQTIDYPNLREDVLKILKAFYPLGLPISLSITPVDKNSLREFRRLGVDYIGVGIDAASERVYSRVKESMYSWEEMWKFVDAVIDVFGEGKAFVHLIFGLGESEEEFLQAVQRAYDSKAKVSIFAFTPVKGTILENQTPPDPNRYRLMQIGVYLIENQIARVEEFKFDNGRLMDFGLSKEELLKVLDESAFMTHGCPGCNRPYYNEKPSREPYNFPVRPEKRQFERLLDKLFHE